MLFYVQVRQHAVVYIVLSINARSGPVSCWRVGERRRGAIFPRCFFLLRCVTARTCTAHARVAVAVTELQVVKVARRQGAGGGGGAVGEAHGHANMPTSDAEWHNIAPAQSQQLQTRPARTTHNKRCIFNGVA